MFSVVIGKVGKVILFLRFTYFSQKETRKQSHMGFLAAPLFYSSFSPLEKMRERKNLLCVVNWHFMREQSTYTWYQKNIFFNSTFWNLTVGNK